MLAIRMRHKFEPGDLVLVPVVSSLRVSYARPPNVKFEFEPGLYIGHDDATNGMNVFVGGMSKSYPTQCVFQLGEQPIGELKQYTAWVAPLWAS